VRISAFGAQHHVGRCGSQPSRCSSSSSSGTPLHP
jgi:hypothetical protein